MRSRCDLTGSAFAVGFVEAQYVGLALDPVGMALFDETCAVLDEQLEADELQRLKAQGAAFDIRQMIAYAQEAVAWLSDDATS